MKTVSEQEFKLFLKNYLARLDVDYSVDLVPQMKLYYAGDMMVAWCKRVGRGVFEDYHVEGK